VINAFSDLESYQEFEIGTGVSYTVKELAVLIKEITSSNTNLNFGGIPFRKGEIMESKVENFELNKLGWKPLYTISDGLNHFIHKL